MKEKQWNGLLKVLRGEVLNPLPVGFIIDCPWLPNWYGVKITDYFSNDDIWLEANLKAMESFPKIMFLPGFWSEYGMCTEPSAFGARCSFPENEFPYAHKVLEDINAVDSLVHPNPKTDGLLPFMLNRLKLNRKKIESKGHQIRFAVARGPFNIASFLMGTTEFLMAFMLQPEKVHKLLTIVTDFLANWIELQRETFPSIDGIFLLDDIIGFVGGDQFKEFGLPYFKRLYHQDVAVKFLHNDAACGESLPFLEDLGINLFNMAFDTDLNELKEATGNKVTMLGNIPPRDVLAAGNPEQVYKATTTLLEGLRDRSRVIFSCGGGMPPGVSTANLEAFLSALAQ